MSTVEHYTVTAPGWGSDNFTDLPSALHCAWTVADSEHGATITAPGGDQWLLLHRHPDVGIMITQFV